MLIVARRLQDSVSLLIVGLMLSAGTASIVSVLQYLSKAEEMQVFVFWTFGSLGNLSWPEIGLLAVILPVGFIIAMSNVKALNAWFLGERYLKTIGVAVDSSRIKIILSASILTGAVTAFCGPIAFVGLAVPHLIKLLIHTGNHKILIPAVMLGGAILMLMCDIIAQLPNNFILPINAVTALIGAPVVIWVVLRMKRLIVSN
jgi:iron complex transport system permease protein